MVFGLATTAPATGLDELTPLGGWDSIAPGIWRATIGDMEQELRYTDLAAEKPVMETLNQLDKTKFPFSDGEISYLRTSDSRIMIRVPTAKNETLYGFGLQLDNVSVTKKVLTLNVDHWGTGGGRTHAPVPFYISSKGYGVFINTSRFLKAYVQVGNRKDSPNHPPPVDRNPPPGEKQPGPWDPVPIADAVEMHIQGNGLEIIIFSGTSMLDVVARYNLLCGGGVLPPLWGLGFWHRVHATADAGQVREEVQQFEKRDFPLDVLGLEPGWQTKSYPCTFEWQKKRFPDPAAFVQGLLKKDIRVNLWQNPYISPESRIYEKMYPLSGSHMVWLGIVPDYTLSEARQIITDQHYQDHISIGVSGYKIDEVDGYDIWLWPDHATFPSGTSAEIMRQSYGLMMQEMLYSELFKKRNVRTYGLVRASNGAASGHPFVIYSDAYGHAQYITGLSTASLGGILWTPEIRDAESDREWLNRFQTVCFSPMAKLNAWFSGKKPWSYEKVTDPVREVIKLRMSLLPYLYTAFADYYRKGIPPVRAMILEEGNSLNEAVIAGELHGEDNPYAREKRVERSDQFMFGPSIMVAPFYEKYALEREVQIPSGNWYDFYTGKFLGNDTTIRVTAEALHDRIPLFVREAALIPMLTEAVNKTAHAQGHPLELRLYGADSGRFDLYEDDGVSFDYQKGKYRIRRIEIRKNSSGEAVVSEMVLKDDANALFGPVKVTKLMSE